MPPRSGTRVCRGHEKHDDKRERAERRALRKTDHHDHDVDRTVSHTLLLPYYYLIWTGLTRRLRKYQSRYRESEIPSTC